MNKICIVVSSYNSEITDGICDSAKNELKNLNIEKFDIIKIPGAFEIPVTISRLSNKYDGFIAIGCIIKGETLNFDLISKSITNGIMFLSTNQKKPIGNAILTCFNKKQALSRLEKGKEAANAVISVLKNVPNK
tara:strand:+ start:591 stop:992 length:402 start_codon:yes stop_codon:yes gene_type:complete